jgi:enoyl-CoA hydratase
MSESQELLIENTGHIRTLTMNRPERSNALSRGLAAAMSEALICAGEEPDVWVIIITGAGDRVFCAGADLKDIASGDEAGTRFRPPMKRPERSVLEVVGETYKPIIAAINGHALAGGCELALACDLRVASETARFGLPEAKLGMGANFGTVMLPRLIPPGLAAELLFTGEPITAAEAARWGLVNRVVPANEVRATAADLAAKIAANAPLTLRRMKELMVKGRDLPVPAALRLDVGPDPYTSEDRVEGIRARAEKRAPRWQGR